MERKKLPTQRIQRLIEHLLPFNFTVQYLPGNKMHIADILSRLAGKDLKPSDQLIPILFNVHTRSTRPLKLYHANKHKTSTNIPYITNTTTPKSTHILRLQSFLQNHHIHQKFKHIHKNHQHLLKHLPYLLVFCGNHFHQNSHHHRKR